MLLRGLLFWPVLAYATVILLQGALMLAYPFAVRLQGLLEAVSGAALLDLLRLALDGLAAGLGDRRGQRPEFAQRMAMLRDTPPLPLAPIMILVVLSVASRP